MNSETTDNELLLPTIESYTEHNGQTLLHVAVSEGHTDILDLLLVSGAEKTVADAHLNTPLHYAAITRQWLSGILLLDHNAAADLANQDGDTPLHLACKGGFNAKPSPTKGRTGVKSSADVVAGATVDPTPITATNRDEIDPAQSDEEEEKRVSLTMEHYLMFLHRLISAAPSSKTALNLEGETPFYCACRAYLAGQSSVVTLLFLHRNNCLINQPNARGFTPLHLACAQRHLELVEILLHLGAKPDGNTPIGSPLDFARKQRFFDVVALLGNTVSPTIPPALLASNIMSLFLFSRFLSFFLSFSLSFFLSFSLSLSLSLSLFLCSLMSYLSDMTFMT
jgi:ankyrin repeat protein